MFKPGNIILVSFLLLIGLSLFTPIGQRILEPGGEWHQLLGIVRGRCVYQPSGHPNFQRATDAIRGGGRVIVRADRRLREHVSGLPGGFQVLDHALTVPAGTTPNYIETSGISVNGGGEALIPVVIDTTADTYRVYFFRQRDVNWVVALVRDSDVDFFRTRVETLCATAFETRGDSEARSIRGVFQLTEQIRARNTLAITGLFFDPMLRFNPFSDLMFRIAQFVPLIAAFFLFGAFARLAWKRLRGGGGGSRIPGM